MDKLRLENPPTYSSSSAHYRAATYSLTQTSASTRAESASFIRSSLTVEIYRICTGRLVKVAWLVATLASFYVQLDGLMIGRHESKDRNDMLVEWKIARRPGRTRACPAVLGQDLQGGPSSSFSFKNTELDPAPQEALAQAVKE